MIKDTTKSLVGQPNYIAKSPALPPHLVEYVRREEQTGKPSQDTAGTAGRIYLQERGGSEVDSSDEDDDPLPTHRQLYDKLLTAINSGLFPYFATFRTPRPSPAKGSPRYNPEEQEQLGNEIAQSLAVLGIASFLSGSFQSINTQKQNPHFHGLLSAQPSLAWSKEFEAKYGRRAANIKFIGLKPKDPARLAYYIARQGVSLSVASESFTRSATMIGG